MEPCNLCGTTIIEGKTPHTICESCGSLFCGECTDKNLNKCPSCGYEG